MEGYLFPKLSGLEIRTLNVSPEFANSVSGSGLRDSFHRAFASTPTVLLFFELFPSNILFFGRGSKRGQRIQCVRSCDQKPYLHNETKGGICIKIEFNLSPKEYFTPPRWPPFLCLLLQHGRRDVM